MSIEIAPDNTFGITAAGTDETYVEVPSKSAGTVYVNSDAGSGLEKITIRFDGSFSNQPGVKTRGLAQVTYPVEDTITGDMRYNTLRIESKIYQEDEATVLAVLKNIGMLLLSSSSYDSLFELGNHRI